MYSFSGSVRRHSLFLSFLHFVFVERSAIEKFSAIMLLDFSTFTSFSSCTVISLMLVQVLVAVMCNILQRAF